MELIRDVGMGGATERFSGVAVPESAGGRRS
jgi:hypothetical protein